METNNLISMEQLRALGDLQRAMAPVAQVASNPVIIWTLVLGACGGILGAITGWINRLATARIYHEVNSKNAAMVAKLDAQHLLIVDLSKKLATLEEREQAERAAKQPQATAEAAGALKKAVATLDQYHTVVGGPKGEPGDPALRTTK